MSVADRRLAPWAFAAIVVLAAAMRLPALDVRPMHTDEAVHAAKFARLLEQGVYEYDPEEFHGPTLNYLTLVPARVRGIARYADLDEITLRSVPAVIGILLVAAHVLLVPVVGFRPAALAALLTAVSPAMVYYSRYYIQETLLVAFSFGALVSICRYQQKPRAGWAIAAGTSVGLMFATKETWVIAFASMAGALVLARVLERRRPAAPLPADRRRTAVHLAAAGLTALAVAGLLMSSFFSHPRGIVDSVTTYTTWVTRAGGASWHIHPWHYYFGLLLSAGSDGSPVWTEAAILGLALIGLVAAFVGSRVPGGNGSLLAFLGAYAVVMVVAYASIPYKTPWCVLGFLHALILLAGVGGTRWIEASPARLARPLVAAVLGAAVVHLGWLAWAGSVRYASDPRNPWVYAHTGTGVFEIARHVDALSRAHPLHAMMPIEVISGQNLWPLPWYLRRFSAVRWETAPVNDGIHAPVILTTPDMENAIRRKLYEWRRPGERELYVPIFDTPVELRPQVEVRGYAAKTLWDETVVR
ncbi:MAG: TIGR03663 family protein [Acidobacteria bacterium]|nr:TIGR03663 family protein [Acidobacteriota bacterium]